MSSAESSSSGISSATSPLSSTAEEVPQNKDSETLQLNIREWAPMTPLLSKIPPKAQKNYTTMDLYLTCICVDSKYLAVGTNVGLVYWYDRENDVLERLKLEDDISPITCVKIVSSVNYMLATGNSEGLIAIYEIPKKLSEHEKPAGSTTPNNNALNRVQRFLVKDMHRAAITVLEWSANGMRLFCGDVSGVVSATEIDSTSVMSKSYELLNEKYPVVQLSYANKFLLISTTFRSIVYSLDARQSHKIGTQDRKMTGNFGSVFEAGLWTKDKRLFASRPGLRLWVSNIEGKVEKTLLFKDLINGSHPYIPVINPTLMKTKNVHEFQFGVLHNFMEKYLVTYHSDVLFILDPENFQIIGSCQELKSIIDLSVHKNEIFILQSNRNLIRLSSEPDHLLSQLPQKPSRDKSIIPDIMSASLPDFHLPKQPLNFISSKLKETSRAIPKINSTLFNTLKDVFETDIAFENGHYSVSSPVIPLKDPNMSNSKSLNDISIDSSTSKSRETPTSVSEPSQNVSSPESRFTSISSKPYEDILVTQFNPKKKSTKGTASQHSSKSKKRGSRTSSVKNSSPFIPVVMSESKSFSDSMSVHSLQSSISEVPSLHMESSSSDPKVENGGASDNLLNNREIEIPIVAPTSVLPEVSSSELELKEELLARRLQWPELLPASAAPIVEEKSKSIVKEAGTEDCQTLTEGFNYENDTRETPVDTGSVESLNFMEDSFSESSFQTETSTQDTLSDSVDIYTKYRESSLDSFGSSFYGPPSGSSNLVSDNVSLLDTIDQTSTKSLSFIGDVNNDEDMDSVTTNLKAEARIGSDSWLQYHLPCLATCLTACENYIACIDSRTNVYYSGLNDVSLKWEKTDFKAEELAISPSGTTVWILVKSSLFSLINPSSFGPYSTVSEKGGKCWKFIMEDVTKVGLSDNTGWILRSDGSVHAGRLKNGELSNCNKYNLDGGTCIQLSVKNGSVWALTCSGRLYYRNKISCAFPFGTEWKERKLGVASSQFSSVSHGPKNTVWFATYNGELYFVSGICSEFPGGNTTLWNVFVEDYIFDGVKEVSGGGRMPFLAASFKSVKSTLQKPYMMYNRLTCKPAAMIASTSSSIWFALQGSQVVHVNKTEVSGHTWDRLSADKSILNRSWKIVSASAIYRQRGLLWLLDSKGKLFHCLPSGGKFMPVDLPEQSSSNPVTCIAPAPEGLWVLTSKGKIYGRCNINSKNPVGHGWSEIQLGPLENVQIVHISCGSDVAWACDNEGKIYIRIGSLNPPCVKDISPAWVLVEGSPSSSCGNSFFTKVYVSSSGLSVWALDNRKNIYAREAVYADLRIGTTWVKVTGIDAVRLAMSDSALWALTPKGEIFRRCGMSEKNFVGEVWKKIPGTAAVLTVSLCDEIWVLDSNGNLSIHSEKTLSISDSTPLVTDAKCVLGEDDGEWEMV